MRLSRRREGDHRRNNSPVKGKPLFFKIIHSSIIRDRKLGIPKKFVRKHGKKLSDGAVLKVRNGNIWHVRLRKTNGVVWFESGWKEFVEYHSIHAGHFLVFKLEENSLFHVLIFDMSGNEINYPSNTGNFDEPKYGGEEIEIKREDSVEIVGVSCDADGSPAIQDSIGKRVAKRRFHTRASTTPQGKDGVIQTATAFSSEHPFFTMTMRSSYVTHAYLQIPRKFVRKFDKDLSDVVVLKVPNGSVWHVRLRRHNDEVWFHSGWQEFVEYHSIRADHFLVFRYDGNSHFSVIIFDTSGAEIDYLSTSDNFKKFSRDERCSGSKKEDVEEDYVETLDLTNDTDRVEELATNVDDPTVQHNGKKPIKYNVDAVESNCLNEESSSGVFSFHRGNQRTEPMYDAHDLFKKQDGGSMAVSEQPSGSRAFVMGVSAQDKDRVIRTAREFTSKDREKEQTVEYGGNISLSQAQESLSSGGDDGEQNPTASISITELNNNTDGDVGGDVQPTTPEVSRRSRGRPPGSKTNPQIPIFMNKVNKSSMPQLPIFITKDSESSMQPIILEISVASDIIEMVSQFAHLHKVCLSILNGSGTVSNITLRHPTSPNTTFTIPGRFEILSLSGSFHSSSSPLTISVSGDQGQVIGGTVTGKLIAAGPVILSAFSFINPSFYRLQKESLKSS